MWIKNNSKEQWLGYNCGGMIVDIKAESTFEVPKLVGEYLLRTLGAPNWLVETEKPVDIVKDIVKKSKNKK